MDLPFDGAISAYFENDAPEAIRNAIRRADKDDIITASYPHPERMARKVYDRQMERLQIELVKLQAWTRSSGTRIACLFEGRDAAGKGGTIGRFRQHLNPRSAHVIALSKPTETEQGEWYFQRYIKHLPTTGEMVFFDRSWYNRGVVEPVFGFCTPAQNAHFFRQVNPFEAQLVDDGIHLFKFWLNVGRGEQLRRMLSRESDPLKQWKLSMIDVKGLAKWDDYTSAIEDTLARSHTDNAPWTIVRSDDKRRARLNAIRTVLHAFEYDRKDSKAIGKIDDAICGGPDLWDA
ncbi:polyphosphate kinase 2 [Sulfitobacter mediterraneus]|jgi:polyphosphate kinase|uniref:polyphosphate kinase 2 n=1 Tax=Sulfitobacter TaxID=60136 RepID=UPI001931AE25|nr:MULTISPECIES: polyphosphate kinase 2 [Sulfitobacter]MBM1631968.1 polyphosphate kinase 2 [Sulfitobacter mediterraneus]MBM1639783.1 polyphosphate kinase 2 [Sulfitobacter mediterraneus]MBM1643832.1 polyphosphate kinase 2 [Sulfitobacter mediterraneus]MBM1647878.1 polyphosphate kinase 2 [Sulfitobacter mediterraneus]MBM1651923.1 polyphosphate kinase 2 [Sulfitobacter mediterraneus]